MASAGQPKVVISDAPPPAVQCRDGVEVAACNQLLLIIRRGQDPIVVITRDRSGAIEAHARSASFTSVAHLVDSMGAATQKLVAALFRRGMGARS